MADNSPILIGRDNSANPGAQTLLRRATKSTSTDPVFTVRTPVGGDGIHGEASGNSTGVEGHSDTGVGMEGISGSTGVRGFSPGGIGVEGISSSTGLLGRSALNVAVQGISTSGFGVKGSSDTGVGMGGVSTSGTGVNGISGSGTGVNGASNSGVGVSGFSSSSAGVRGLSSNAGVYGRCFAPDPLLDHVGGYFDGGIKVVNGLKPFTIDHPLDPQNKYLVHTSVESSEMKNVYDGVAQLDKEGAAWVELPEWFEALNGDFRYQLTAVGGAAPNLHVAEEVSENRFKIAGG